MTFDQFQKFQNELFEECKQIAQTKGKEYAHSEDRFANFKRCAEKKKCSPLLVASIYLDKHLDSIDSYVAAGQTFSTETIRSRFVDAITYLSLIAGMVYEIEKDRKGSIVASNMDGRVCSICGQQFKPDEIVNGEANSRGVRYFHKKCPTQV